MRNIFEACRFMLRLMGKFIPCFLIPASMLILITACSSSLKNVENTTAVGANLPDVSRADEVLAFNESRTYCLGRYLVDIPVEAEWVDEKNSYFFTKITPIKGKENYEKTRDSILNYRTNDPAETGYFYSKKDSFTGKLPLYVSKKNYGSFDLYTLDTFTTPTEGYYIAFRGMEVPDGSPECGREVCVKSFEHEQLKEVISIYRKHILPSSIMRLNNDVSEIPPNPGFCVGYAFIADTDKISKIPHEEMVSLRFELKDHPDVEIKISSGLFGDIKNRPLSERQSYLREVKSFPEKAMSIEDKQINRFVPIKRIRSGQLTVNGRQGEEDLFILQPDETSGEAYFFIWEAQGDSKDLSNPRLYLEVFAGEGKYFMPPPYTYNKIGDLGAWGARGSSSLAAKDVQRLFDAIVKTIRIRPITGAKP